VGTVIFDHQWNKRWLLLAHQVATWSKDQTKVGAVIFDHNRNPRGFGYNGIPRGLDDQKYLDIEQPYKSWTFEHAERNVIYSCARNGISCDGCTLAVTHWPCCDCSRAIIQSGISHVLVDQACMDPSLPFFQKWQPQIQLSQQLLMQAQVNWLLVDLNQEK